MFKFIFILPLIFSFQSAIASTEQILLAPGQKEFLQSSDSIWIENRKIVKVEDSGRGFTLIGAKPGQTQVRIGRTFKTVSVLDPAQHQSFRNFQKSISGTLNLSVEINNGQVTVKGRLVRLEDWLKLKESCILFDCKYQMSIEVSNELKEKIQEHFRRVFEEQGLPQQKILFSEPLSVQLAQSEFATETEDLLKKYGIRIIKLKNSMEMAPLVRVQITIAEIKKNELLNYGLSWSNSYQAQLLPKFSGNQPVSVTLNLLEQNGLGKILASPNILCRSGKAAEFVAGGEFPIKIMNYKTQDVLWKKYGIVLKLKPIADFSGRMSISLETEISSIDKSTAVDGVPGLLTNKVQSHFDLAESRVIALSGLIKSEQSQSSQGLPGLGQIPILGSLFSSKDFRENRTELVIFVKPEIVNPLTERL